MSLERTRISDEILRLRVLSLKQRPTSLWSALMGINSGFLRAVRNRKYEVESGEDVGLVLSWVTILKMMSRWRTKIVEQSSVDGSFEPSSKLFETVAKLGSMELSFMRMRSSRGLIKIRPGVRASTKPTSPSQISLKSSGPRSSPKPASERSERHS